MTNKIILLAYAVALVVLCPGATNAEEYRIDFGSSNYCTGEVICNRDALSADITAEHDIVVRKLLAHKRLILQFPANNEFPETPMLLTIHYKDVLPPQGYLPEVSSRINYTHDDPLVDGGYNIGYHPIGWLGSSTIYSGFPSPVAADEQWKTMRYGFAKTPFQLLRSFGGKYYVQIDNASTAPNTIAFDIPISSVTLKSITEADYEELKHSQMADEYAISVVYYGARGDTARNYRYTRVDLPKDAPPEPVAYAEDPVVFVRDPMRPIYRHTAPKAEEIAAVINISSAPGEIEPLSMGVYSKNGVSGISFNVSDLTSEDGGSVIPAGNIEMKKVVYNEKRMGPYMSIPSSISYNLLPDYLDDAGELTVEAGTSQGVWAKIDIPSDVPGGRYKGFITVKKGDAIVKRIDLGLDLLPIKLDASSHINTGHTSPYTLKTVQVAEGMKLFRDAGFEPFIWESGNDIRAVQDSSGEGLDFDISNLRDKVWQMYDNNIIKGHVVFMEWNLRGEILAWLKTKDPALYNDPTRLWEQVTDERFARAYAKAIVQIMALGNYKEGFEVIFTCVDEPRDKVLERILSDRMYTIIRSVGGKTYATYHSSCESPIPAGNNYKVPGGLVPALTDLVDYKVWAPQEQDVGYEKPYPNYGYYTTNTSYLSLPVYNRFSNGLLAYATDAKLVHMYAINSMASDPFNDFDRYSSKKSDPDYAVVYPTWTKGKWLPRLALEGVREGIKDAKFIATLGRLIDENSGLASAKEAAGYLLDLKGRIDKKFNESYVKKQNDEALALYNSSNGADLSLAVGYYKKILKNVSTEGGEDDFEAFTKVRNSIITYIRKILAEAEEKTPPDDPGTSEEPDTPVVPKPTIPVVQPLDGPDAQPAAEIKQGTIPETPPQDAVPRAQAQNSGGCSLIIMPDL